MTLDPGAGDLAPLRAAHAAAARTWPCIALSEAAFLPFLASRARALGDVGSALTSCASTSSTTCRCTSRLSM